MSTTTFIYLCKQVGLSMDDMDKMGIGGCIDYIEEWLEHNNNNKEQSNNNSGVREATQADFDAF